MKAKHSSRKYKWFDLLCKAKKTSERKQHLIRKVRYDGLWSWETHINKGSSKSTGHKEERSGHIWVTEKANVIWGADWWGKRGLKTKSLISHGKVLCFVLRLMGSHIGT